MAFPTPTNISTLGGIVQYIHTVEGNFFNLLLVVLWIIIFLAMRTAASSSIAVPFAVASFIMFLLAITLMIIEVIHFPLLIIFLAMFAISVIWILNEPS